MNETVKVSVLGAGTWGTAITILLANKGYDLILWSNNSEKASFVDTHRTEVPNLEGAILPESVVVTDDIELATKDRDLIVFAVASPYVRQTAHFVSPYIKQDQVVVNVAKGIEFDTLFTLSDVMKEELPQADIAVLSGPSHAEEVSKLIPTTCVVAAESKATACFVQDVFMTERFRVYTSPDIVGVEIGGSLKNVIALAAGISDGLGFGDNTKAALITRGVAEICRLGMKMGGKFETFSGLSGIGDLVVTCTSTHSRNWNAGYLIGKGDDCDTAMKKVNQVVEGVHSAKAALALSKKYGVEMPIIEQVNLILFENKAPKEAVVDLFLREKRQENKAVEW